MLLLQITETAATETVRSMSLWNLCLQGGWTMIPLAALLLLSIYVTIERAIILHKGRLTPTESLFPVARENLGHRSPETLGDAEVQVDEFPSEPPGESAPESGLSACGHSYDENRIHDTVLPPHATARGS